MFSADLTIAFVLVTVLTVPCSFGGWSVQIQMLEGEFWIPICVVYVPCYLLSPASSAVKIHWHQREKWDVSLNVRICGGMADVLIVAHDWLFSANHGAHKCDYVNNFIYCFNIETVYLS